jgi:hypothetical protein
MDEFIECLSLFQHLRILLLLMGQALQESIHVKAIQLSSSLLIFGGSVKMLPIGVEQACKTTNKSRPNAVCMEGCWAHQGYMTQAATVCCSTTARTFIDAITFWLVITNRAN